MSNAVEAFEHELDLLLMKVSEEWDISTAAAVGVLQMKIYEIIEEARESDDEP